MTELHKTILVKKVRVDSEDPSMTSSSIGDEAKYFARFRQLVKQLPSEEIVQVKLLLQCKQPQTPLSVVMMKKLRRCTFTRVRPNPPNTAFTFSASPLILEEVAGDL